MIVRATQSKLSSFQTQLLHEIDHFRYFAIFPALRAS